MIPNYLQTSENNNRVYQLPEPDKNKTFSFSSKYLREISYDKSKLEEWSWIKESLLNSNQLYVYQQVLYSVD